jgi:hypothetical protein
MKPDWPVILWQALGFVVSWGLAVAAFLLLVG